VAAASPSNVRAFAALAAGVMTLGLSPVIFRLSVMAPSATAVHRVLLALPFLAIWMYVEQRGRYQLFNLPRRDWQILALAGLLWTGDLVFWHWALTLTTIANANLLSMVGPIFVTLGAWLLFRERITLGFTAGLALALMGAALLTVTSAELGMRHMLGDGMALGAAACFAGYLLAIKRLRSGLPTGTVMFFTCLFSLPGLVFAAVVSGESMIPPTLQAWAVLLALALVGQVAGQALIAIALNRLPASFTSTCMMVQPFLAILFGALILGERATLFQLVCGLTVLTGIVISRRFGAPAAPLASG
jgi:drug/metabolite transporter (DMT)-like permease